MIELFKELAVNVFIIHQLDCFFFFQMFKFQNGISMLLFLCVVILILLVEGLKYSKN